MGIFGITVKVHVILKSIDKLLLPICIFSPPRVLPYCYIVLGTNITSTFDLACVGDWKLSCSDSLFVGPKPMVALSLAELPGNSKQLVLAMGGLDSKIHLYCGERNGKV